MSWDTFLKEAADRPWMYAPPGGVEPDRALPFIGENHPQALEKLQGAGAQMQEGLAHQGTLPNLARGAGQMGTWILGEKALNLGLRGLSKVPRVGRVVQPLMKMEKAYEEFSKQPGFKPALRAQIHGFLPGKTLLGQIASPKMRALGSVIEGPSSAAAGVGDRLAAGVNQRLHSGDYAQQTQQAMRQTGVRAINQAYDVRVNPLQQFIQMMNKNPNARNAMVGLLGGGLGGAALGSTMDSPWLGALLGALGGGALAGNNPTWGNDTWNDFYNTAGRQNYRPSSSPVKAPTP